MMKIPRYISLFFFAVLAATTAFAFTGPLPQDNGGEFRWRGEIENGKSVEIKGVNGNVRAEAALGNEVEIVAVKRSGLGKGDPQAVKVELVQHSDGVTVCALYPQRNGQLGKCDPGAGGQSSYKNGVEVNFTVRVPASAHFIGRTVNGGVIARSLGGNVLASTVNGGIEISTSGYAKATTVNGGINATCGRADWEGALEFQTINGGIELALPENTRSEIHANTVNGSISTDLPLYVEGKLDKRQLHGMLGGGGENRSGRQLKLSTINGSIRVLAHGT